MGAFAALVSQRLPRDEPLAWTRIGGGGRSRLRYLFLGLAGALLGGWAAFAWAGPMGVIGAILGAWLLLLAVLDAEHLWLPLRLTAPLVLFGLIVTGIAAPDALAGRMIGAGAGFAAFWGLAWLYRRMRRHEGLGGGDAWLAAAAGAWVGWEALPKVVLIAAGAALAGVAVLAAARKLDASRPIPFGLYLEIGFWLVWIRQAPGL